MLALPPRRLAPAFALSLLCLPLLARAQTRVAKPDAVPQVRLQVSFFSISKTDIDNFVLFDPPTYSPPKNKQALEIVQLRTVTGNIASQLYQIIIRPRGNRVLSVPAVVVADKTTAKFVEDTQIQYLAPQTNDGLSAHTFYVPLADQKMRRLQTSLSITPRVNADGTVTLAFVPLDGDLNAPPKAVKLLIAKTVSTGQVVALTGLPFSKEKQPDDQELFVFVTPTVLESKAAAVDVSSSR